MGIETNSGSVPGGLERDRTDFARLRHAREQHEGFPVGRFLQPPPMLFTRDGHNVFLGDMYRGHTAFLLCSGPSLTNHDLSKLNQRGILTLALNNAATVFRPHLWCSVDDPGNFADAIWYDPGILKFVPLCHMEKTFLVRDDQGELIPSSNRVGDMPAVFGYRRNEAFRAEQWLYEDTFNWGNHSERMDVYGNKGSRSVMYIALRLLFYLGVRSVYLLGCDFKMAYGRQNYAFEQDRSRASVRGNNSSYRILNVRLGHLKPHFEREGFQVFNCTPNSGLTVFPHVPYEEAIKYAGAIMPQRIVTAGMYDRKQRLQDAETDQQKTQAKFSQLTVNDILSNLTLLLAVDENSVKQLTLTWGTWMKFRPELKNVPVIVIHDGKFDPNRSSLKGLSEHPRLRYIPWTMPEAESQRERMLTAFVRVAAQEVQTEWYLKLDCDVVATDNSPWIDPNWFIPDEKGRLPAFVASPWGYTKPANAIAKLDDWGDTVPELRTLPRLEVPFDAESNLVRHPRVASWCFFGNTQWTKTVAGYSTGRLPVPSHDTYLFYCAARRKDHFVRAKMSNSGWKTISAFRRLARTCREILRDDKSQAQRIPVSASSSALQECGVLYFLSGDKHAVRFLVSVHSLRSRYSGPVTVISTDEAASRICQQIMADDRLQINHRPLNDPRANGRKKASYLFKTRLQSHSPYERTLYLDCDTLVTGDLSPLWEFPDPAHILVTQFCDWKSQGRTIAKRIRSWEDTHPDLVPPALGFGPAINTGVFAFTNQTQIFERWSQVAEEGRGHFIPDELAMQLLVPHYPHVVLDGRFNCSPRYGQPEHPETRIVHYHGNRHVSRNGQANAEDRWIEQYQTVYEENLGNVRSWSPAGDKRLRKYLRKYSPALG